MEMLQGKHFSITDPKGVNTVIYQINKTKKEFLKDYPKYTVERLDFTEEIRGENRRKTFYVDEPQPNGNQLVIDDEVRISKTPTPFKFNTLYSEEEQEFKEFNYTPNMKRDICVIDPETTEELKPRLYYDENEDKVKGRCKLKPYKSYFAFEVRDDDGKV